MKYPYIGFNEKSKSTVLFYDERSGTCLEEGLWTGEKWNYYACICDSNFENTTYEYLRNSNVKIESVEHELLVRNMASYVDLSFVLINGTAFIFDCDMEDANREVLLPMPPKKSKNLQVKETGEPVRFEAADEANKESIEPYQQTAVVAAIETLSNMGYTYHGGELWKPPIAEAIKEPKPKDWPQVGDEVFCEHPSGQTQTGELLALTKEYAIIQQEGYEQHLYLKSWELSKPLTPEEELKEKLTEITDKYRNQQLSIQELIAKAIIKGEIKGLSYKPE